MKYHLLPPALEQYGSLSEQEAAQILGVSVQSLRFWRFLKKEPPYTKPNSRNVRYVLTNLFAYMNHNRVDPEGQESVHPL